MVLKLCSCCIRELKSQGKSFRVADDIMCTAEESKEENERCDWCRDFDELWFCWK